VEVVALEMGLKEDDKPIHHGAVCEVVDEEIETHTGTDAEEGSEPKRDTIPAV